MRTALVSRSACLLAGFACMAAAANGVQPDACGLLSADAIRQATGEQAASTKATLQTAGKVQLSQCVYVLPTFTNSVSVTLTGPAGRSRDGAREMWQHWFHGEERDRGEEEEAAAKAAPVTGVGDEAYWVHSFVGNLYVRKGNQFLRISLGGKMSDEERQARARVLAAEALRRLR